MKPAISSLPSVALIAGPTASGKSALAMALARALAADGRAAVIVNADASQVYRDIPILSAAPSPAERAEVPHRLVGHIDGAEACDAARWAGEATAAIAAAHAAGAVPIVVGGTGLYIDLLLGGIAPVPAIDPAVRAEVRALPVEEARARLAALDPAAAARLGPLDRARIARALEVVAATGTPLAEWQRQRAGGIAGNVALAPLLLLPPREWLRGRCDARLAAMIAAGAPDEVAALVARRLDPALPVMRAIGVREIAAALAGQTGMGKALTAAQVATRQYAKRQSTFFRGQFPADWPRVATEISDSIIADLVTKFRCEWLTG